MDYSISPNGPSQGHPNGLSQGQPEASTCASVQDVAVDADASGVSGDSGVPRELRVVLDRLPESTLASSGGDRFWENEPKRRRTGSTSSVGSEGLGSETPKSSILDVSVTSRRSEFLRRKEVRVAQAEGLIANQLQKAGEERAIMGLVVAGEGDARTIQALNDRIMEDVAIIANVATKSGNLKGTFVRALKESAASIKKAVEVLRSRSSTEETAILQANNSRLQAEVAELRKEMGELRREMAERTSGGLTPLVPQRPGPPEASATPGGLQTEELTRAIMLQVGGMLNARLEAYEERLLPEKRIRPPLAVDKRGPLVPSAVAQPSGPPSKKASQPKKVVPRPLPPAPQNMDEGWSVVTRRGTKTKKGQGVAMASGAVAKAALKPKTTAGQKSTSTTKAKLRPPRSSAVVITLQPEAEERGITYAKVLAEARQNISLADCGIVGLRCRKAVTGARILEVPGVTSGEKADSLAQKLRESLGETVKVSRPSLCSELRIVGLDDSVTTEEVAAAVAQHGGCPVESVKVGEIKMDSRGSGAVWTKCPVTAAKKLQAGGRLLIGWVSASVKMLEPRPMRCYRCLETGHVRVNCTSEVDRSDECYRCGQPGHKAAGCTATAPKCSLCAAANKPSDHRSGDKKCSHPKSKKGKMKPGIKPAASSSPPTQPVAVEAMSVS